MLHLYDQKGFDEWIAKLFAINEYGWNLPRHHMTHIRALCGHSQPLEASFLYLRGNVGDFPSCPACSLVSHTAGLPSYFLSFLSRGLASLMLDVYDPYTNKYYYLRVHESDPSTELRLPGQPYRNNR